MKHEAFGDIPYRFKIYATCEPCRRSVALDVRHSIEKYGPVLTVDEVRNRIRCARCGKRTRDLQVVHNIGRQ